MKSPEEIIVAGVEIINEDGKNSEILNNFFSDVVKNLKMPEYQEEIPLANNISYPMFRNYEIQK